MEEIVWTEKFSVGIERFDDHHKRLIGMINRLIRDPGATTGSETVAELLTDMISYARMHFAEEESLLAEYSYPRCEEQIKQHQAFRKKTVKFCTATAIHVDVVPQVMLKYLREWLVHHILESDMAYKSFFQERGVK